MKHTPRVLIYNPLFYSKWSPITLRYIVSYSNVPKSKFLENHPKNYPENHARSHEMFYYCRKPEASRAVDG